MTVDTNKQADKSKRPNDKTKQYRTLLESPHLVTVADVGILVTRLARQMHVIVSEETRIHLIPKWPPFKYSFVSKQIGPYGLIQG